MIHTPPFSKTSTGHDRRVGVEIEFANVSVLETASLIEELYKGEQRVESEHRVTVENTVFGTFTVELDWQGIHKTTIQPGNDPIKTELDKVTRTAIGHAASLVVPTEIVCPPIPWRDLDALDSLFDRLRLAGAQGTEEAAFYGFGLHLNPEVAEETVDYILRHLRAYSILEDWLRDRIEIDLTRQILPHVAPFPAEYVRQILAENYSPDLVTLMRDYISSNPTRNRGLDMLPLFRHLNEKTLMSSLDDASLVKGRPTFHYRLPNAQLSNRNWRAVTEWNRWLEVEKLAADPSRLNEWGAIYHDWLSKPVHERWLQSLKKLFG